jgi:hypothetical protein
MGESCRNLGTITNGMYAGPWGSVHDLLTVPTIGEGTGKGSL